MKKKGLIATLLSISLVSVLAIPFIVTGYALLSPSVFEDTFLGELNNKIERLKSTNGKRIVLIGGSSIPFGLRSELVKKYLPEYEVVDFGLYASLGSNVMLDFAKARINKDDILLFVPEQHEQTLSMYYNGDSLWQALDGHFNNISLLNYETRQRLYGDLYKFSQDKYKFNTYEKIDLGDSIYQRSSFNTYGDIKEELTPYNTMYDLYDVTTSIRFDNDIIKDDFIDYLNDFNNYVNKKEAHLYYYFCPMNIAAIKDEEKVDTYYDYLTSKLNFDILGNPHDSIMDKEWFYDTNFHLNSSGSRLYTKKLIQNIKLLLNDTSVTDIEEPIKPDIPEDEGDKDIDNSQEDNFSYIYKDNSYVISGIKTPLKHMIVPYYHEGIKISGFNSDVFSNRSDINEITIQNNVRYIYDYSFSGCSNLTKIHLSSKKPSSINIGDHLLDGCDANIYVPVDIISLYITNYTFSRYATRILTE